MRPLYGEARRAEALADALERGGDQRLSRETAHLVGVVDAVRRAELESPRPEFAVALRERLMQDAPQALAVSTRPVKRVVRVKPITPQVAPHRLRRRLATAGAVLAVAGGSFGLVSTSAQALPGDTLYPVKRGVERVELGLSQGQTSVGRTRLDQADERLAEVQRLTRGDVDAREAALIDDTLASFSTGARAGAATMLSAYADRGNQETVTQLNKFAATSAAALTEVAPDLASANDDAYAGAAKTINQVAQDARAACDVCATSAVSPIPTTLQATVDDLASKVQPAPAGGDPDATTQPPATDDDAKPKGSKPAPSAGSPTPAPSPAPSVPDKTPAPTLPDTGTDPDDGVGDKVVPPTLKQPVKAVTDPLLKKLLGGDGEEGLVPPVLPGLTGSLLN